MAIAQLEIVNDSGVVIISHARNLLCLLQKGGSKPASALFGAGAPGGSTYWFGFPTPGGSTYGFQIFDADGTTVLFDALNYGKLVKPVGVMVGSLGVGEQAITVTKTFAIPAGKTYAVWVHKMPSAFLVRPFSTKIGSTWNYQYALDDQEVSVSFTSSLITLTATRVRGSPQGNGRAAPYTGGGDPIFRAIVLDITNF